MIPKISSDELNNVLTAAKGSLDALDKKFEITKNDLEKKLKVINYESIYVQTTLNKIKENAYQKVDGLVSFSKLDKKTEGKYEKYGSTIHAELIKSPINIFNLDMSSFNQFYFREDVKVSVNGKPEEEYLSILKHDSIDKPIFFDTFNEDVVTIKIELSDLSVILGPTRFNAIEIEPFLHGSFDIQETRIYEFTENGTIDKNKQPIRLNKITNVGSERIILSRKINFYKIEFDVKINYEIDRSSVVVYPFGLKHIYFYEMDFKKDSYLIAEINSDKTISYIKNDISIKTPYGEKQSKISLEGIELFLDRDGKSDKLYSPIEASDPDDIREISRSVKKIYARIPISSTANFIGMRFDVVTRTT